MCAFIASPPSVVEARPTVSNIGSIRVGYRLPEHSLIKFAAIVEKCFVWLRSAGVVRRNNFVAAFAEGDLADFVYVCSDLNPQFGLDPQAPITDWGESMDKRADILADVFRAAFALSDAFRHVQRCRSFRCWPNSS